MEDGKNTAVDTEEVNEATSDMVEPDMGGAPERATIPMPGLTATMEIAGVESIPGVDPGAVILGFARED